VRLANDRPRLVHPLEVDRPLRRYSSLTELRASDIASPPTNGGSLDTVAQALDRLDGLVSELRGLQQDLRAQLNAAQAGQAQLRSDFDDLSGDVWRVQRDWISNLTINPPPRGQQFPQTGFQRLPSGLVISWGVHDDLELIPEANVPIRLPITHPRRPHVLISSGTYGVHLTISRVDPGLLQVVPTLVTDLPRRPARFTAGFIAIG
jgi:hypothetical protein